MTTPEDPRPVDVVDTLAQIVSGIMHQRSFIRLVEFLDVKDLEFEARKRAAPEESTFEIDRQLALEKLHELASPGMYVGTRELAMIILDAITSAIKDRLDARDSGTKETRP